MSRFISALFAGFFLVLVPTIASAQDQPMPGRGEILELRRNDPRYQEGYRSFIYGSWVPGMDGLGDLLDRVNADLEGDSLVTLEQLDAANNCIVIYHRDGHRFGHNGVCGTNSTAERVTYASYCDGDSTCARWPMANRVYRIPSAPRLTPGERAEEMVHTLDGTAVTETVPAPAELGSWMTELSDLMGEEQAPSYDQVRNVLAAVGRTLTRAETASADTVAGTVSDPVVAMGATAPDMTFTEEEHLGTSTDDAALRPTSAEDEAEHTSSTSLGTATSILMNPSLLWLIIVFLSGAMILLLLKDKLRAWYRPTSFDDDQEPPETESTPPRPTEDEVRGKKLSDSLQVLWKQFFKKVGRNDQLTEESLNLFFVTADTNRVLVVEREGRIEKLEKELKIKPVTVVDEKRVKELEKEVAALKNAPKPEPVIKHVPVSDPAMTARILELEGKLKDAEQARMSLDGAQFAASMKASQDLENSRQAWEKKEGDLSRWLREARDELLKHEATLARSEELLTQLNSDWMEPFHESVEETLKAVNSPLMDSLIVMALVERIKGLFQNAREGMFVELYQMLAPDLVLVPAEAFAPSGFGGVDSWTGVLDDSVPEIAGDRTSHGVVVPGFGGAAPSDPPSEAKPLSLPPMDTKPGVVAPTAEAPASKPVSRKERRERKRKSTDSFELAPTRAKEPRDDEKTGVFDPAKLAHKRVEVRTGKTITPGGTRSALDDSPIPGSLIPPPPPVVSHPADLGEEPDPPRSMSSIFEEGNSEETGVTIKKVVGKD